MAAQMRVLTPEHTPWHLFGAKVRELRIVRGWSQGELGRRVAASKSLISRIETADRYSQPDLTCRLDIALGAFGEILRCYPAPIARSRSDRPGSVTVTYAGLAGTICLRTADPSLIEFCDHHFTRSYGCEIAWTIEVSRHGTAPSLGASPPAFAEIQVDTARAISRIGAAAPDILIFGTRALLSALNAGLDPNMLDSRWLRRYELPTTSVEVAFRAIPCPAVRNVFGDEEVVMQAVEVEAVAPVSVCFGRRSAVSGAFCPQVRRDTAEALPQVNFCEDWACTTSVTALGQFGGKCAEWLSSPLTGLGNVRREAVAPCL
jgi:transcriptional regulator with XRE-family HTH domain